VSDPRIELLEQELVRRRNELAWALEAVRQESRNVVPQEGGWSVAMVLEHLAQTERSVTGLLGKLVSGVTPRSAETFSRDEFLGHIDMPAFLDRTRKLKGSQPSGGVRADEAWKALQETRKALLTVLRQCAGLRLEDGSFNHPLGRELDGYQWAAFVALHESRHAAQIQEISQKMQREA
jgi:hypothetical protein